MRLTLARCLTIVAIASPALYATEPFWYRVDSPGTRVCASVPQSEVRDSAHRCAAFRQVFERIFGPVPPRPLDTWVFFREAASPWAGMTQPGAAAAVNWVETESFGCHDTAFALDDDPADGWEEAWALQARLYLERIFRQPPGWFVQGISACLSTTDFARNGDVAAGRLDRRCSRWLERLPAMPWAAFFRATYGFVDRPAADDPVGPYYTQAWLVAHALLLRWEQGRGTRDLAGLCRRLHGDARDEFPVEAWLGLNPGGLSAALQHADPTQALLIAVNGPRLRHQLNDVPLSEAERDATWYDVMADSNPLRAAVALAAAKRLAPDSPQVLASEARQALRAGDSSGAANFFRRAIAAGCENGYAYYVSARQRLDDVTAGRGEIPGDGGGEAVRAVAELTRALHLEPDNPLIYIQLSRALYLSPKLDRSQIGQVMPGLTDSRSLQGVRYYLGLIKLRWGDRPGAAREFRAIIADPRAAPRDRTSASRALARLDRPSSDRPAPLMVATPIFLDDSEAAPPACQLAGVTALAPPNLWKEFGPYMDALAAQVQQHWAAPPGARSFSGSIAIGFSVTSENVFVQFEHIRTGGAPAALVESCKAAVKAASPYPPWSDAMRLVLSPDQHLMMRFDF